MVRRQNSLVILALIIVSLLCGPVLAADTGNLASAQALEAGLIGQEGGESYSVALLGDNAFVGIGPRLAIFNVLDPTAPTLTGKSAPLPDIVQGIAAAGAAVYAAAGDSGLHILDVTNASLPEWQGSHDTPGWAHSVAVAGNYAYVADGDGGLRIINVSSPLAPVEADFLTATELGGDAIGIAVVGSTAYVGASIGGLVVVDVTDPTDAQVIGTYPVPVATNVAVLGSTAFVVNSQDLRVLSIDVSNASSPQLEDQVLLSGIPVDLDAVGSYLYVAVGDVGLDIFLIDAATGEIVNYQATQDTPGEAYDVAVDGGYAFVADGPTGLRIIDVLPDAMSPVEVASYQTLGDALGVDVAGDYAYVASGDQGISVLSLLDLANPTPVGSLDTPGYAQAVIVRDALAYIADGTGGLAIANVATPGSPLPLGQRALPNDAYAWAVALQGNYAYVAAEDQGLQVLNVSNPSNPTLVGTGFQIEPDSVWDVVVAGSYAYVAAGDSGVRVLDISTPAAPVEVASILTNDFAWALDLAGAYLYIADIAGGLGIVNVALPSSPVPVATFTGTLGAVTDVAVRGLYALVTTGDAVAILDVSNPAIPVLRASYATAGTPQAVGFGGFAALVTDLDGGLRVVFDPILLRQPYEVCLPIAVK